VIAMMLCAEKRLPDAWIHEPPEVWNLFDLGGLYGRTLGLLGLGGIAQETAKRALAFGMTVIAHRRTAKPSPIAGVELVDFDALLARSDHFVVAAPATRETRQLIGRDAIARMKRGVHLVNIARGDLVDQDALRAALDDDTWASRRSIPSRPSRCPPGTGCSRIRASGSRPTARGAGPVRSTACSIRSSRISRAGSPASPLLELVDVELGY
jgi:hypothetical protein